MSEAEHSVHLVSLIDSVYFGGLGVVAGKVLGWWALLIVLGVPVFDAITHGVLP